MNMAKMSYNDIAAPLTPEEIAELEAAEARDIVYDEDSPRLTAEQLMEFKRVNRENRNKPTVSLRVSPETLRKAKQYGKGYTSLLSRLLDAAIDDEDLIRRCI